MRRLFEQIDSWMARKIETPDWVTDAIKIRNKEDEEQGKAAAWKRMGGAAPGEPGDGGLAKTKSKVPGKATKWSSKNRGLDKPPRHITDGRATYDDGKDNKSRPIGTYARFKANHGETTRIQLHAWCVCDESKAANDQNPFWPGHSRSTQGNPANHNRHKNAGEDGSTYNSSKARAFKPSAFASAKGKGAASAATSDTSSTVADQDLKRAAAHIDHLNRQIRELGKSRDEEHLKYSKATELANTQLNLQAKTINEMTSSNAKALRSSQNKTVKAIVKISSIRGHAEGFADNMLHNRRAGMRPTWSRRGRPSAACSTPRRSTPPTGASARSALRRSTPRASSASPSSLARSRRAP